MATITGQVKWFNTKTGFGFITCLTGEQKDNDIFVHHSDLNVNSDVYRYLVMGEYVTFEVMETDDEHKIKAHKVAGIEGGKLMCEVKDALVKERRERASNEAGSTENQRQPRRRGGRGGGRGRGRGRGGRGGGREQPDKTDKVEETKTA